MGLCCGADGAKTIREAIPWTGPRLSLASDRSRGSRRCCRQDATVFQSSAARCGPSGKQPAQQYRCVPRSQCADKMFGQRPNPCHCCCPNHPNGYAATHFDTSSNQESASSPGRDEQPRAGTDGRAQEGACCGIQSVQARSEARVGAIGEFHHLLCGDPSNFTELDTCGRDGGSSGGGSSGGGSSGGGSSGGGNRYWMILAS